MITGNLSANLVRNVWSFMIIFCGHFPEGVEEFSEQEVENESRGGWYLRQMLGSANLTGSRLFHVLSGNLSHQIEHHLFPSMPRPNLRRAQDLVAAFCADRGVTYTQTSLLESYARALGHLAAVGGEVARPVKSGNAVPLPAQR